jgi:hypothetical protein
MRFVSLALFLVAAALCFVAGYKLGKDSQPPTLIASQTSTEEAPIAELSDTGNQPQLTVELPKDEPTPHLLALRAKETIQTFFDTNERKLVAQILEVREDSLKVRRQSDGKELELPLAMLSTEDQAFAAYLWEQQPKTSAAAPSRSAEDIFWDELFK